MLSLCLFNFYAEYIMRNAGLEEVQAGIKITGRNNLRYADDTTLMAGLKLTLKLQYSGHLMCIEWKHHNGKFPDAGKD